MMTDVKMKSLELAMINLDKQFGKNSVFKGDFLPEEVKVIPTGNFELDLALGVGGLPKGRVVEIYGAEALGKSLLCLSTVAMAQKAGMTCAYIDMECDLDPTWAKFLGVNMDELYIAQPEYGEAALDIAIALAKTGAIDMIVIDSVASLVPKAELDGAMEDNFMGLQARMMGQAMRKIRNIASETETCLVFINQIRDTLGPRPGTTTPGGRALKFAASVRIELKLMETLKNSKGEFIGVVVKALIKKNKVAPPMKSVEYRVLHGVGFNNNISIVERAENYNLILKKGTWFYKVDWDTGETDEKTFAQGVDNAAEYLSANPDYAAKLEQKVREMFKEKKK